jgi:UDP-2,3-diacylglucosamine hydrolase
MDNKLGIIAGSGEFPHYVCRGIRSLGKQCVVAAIAGEADASLQKEADVFQIFSLDDFNRITGFLHDQQIHEVLLAGKIEHRRIFKKGVARSWGLKMIRKGKDRNPATLISLALEYLRKQDLEVLDPRPFLSETFCAPGFLSGVRLKRTVSADIDFGWPLIRKIADMDIGQTIVVKNLAVVAVEGMEGTNAVIKRAGELAGSGTVVVKSGRTDQDPRIDLPAVGLNTIKACLEAGCAALCFEAGAMPFFQKEEALQLAHHRGLAVITKSA